MMVMMMMMMCVGKGVCKCKKCWFNWQREGILEMLQPAISPKLCIYGQNQMTHGVWTTHTWSHLSSRFQNFKLSVETRKC